MAVTGAAAGLSAKTWGSHFVYRGVVRGWVLLSHVARAKDNLKQEVKLSSPQPHSWFSGTLLLFFGNKAHNLSARKCDWPSSVSHTHAHTHSLGTDQGWESLILCVSVFICLIWKPIFEVQFKFLNYFIYTNEDDIFLIRCGPDTYF